MPLVRVILGSVRHRARSASGSRGTSSGRSRPGATRRPWSTPSRTGSRCSTGCTRNMAGQAPEVLERLAGQIKAADAFIIVSGEYNHSIPPALSNLLDHFLEEYFWRPSAIVCYSAGPFGGVRAAMQLRAMLCELGTPSIPSFLPIPTCRTPSTTTADPRDEAYHRPAARFLDELEWYANALKAAGRRAFPTERWPGRGGRPGRSARTAQRSRNVSRPPSLGFSAEAEACSLCIAGTIVISWASTE